MLESRDTTAYKNETYLAFVGPLSKHKDLFCWEQFKEQQKKKKVVENHGFGCLKDGSNPYNIKKKSKNNVI